MDVKIEDSDYEFVQPCPIRDVLDRIGDQWSLLVLEALEVKTLRFNALSREIGDISNCARFIPKYRRV
ncbi:MULTISPECIES: helix-turn-helix domain-containing protein [unclassified Desulfovibrio]|uniref:winged helix-turn-helix transcriptional regulator n=1 Tax=unclassified Desulfovibrio TaxID=2593640 RepID=UPI001C8A30EB|nr:MULTISPECIES: winged helix-turn-helix transcriptional regulator [unclassified Desulfovibrio]